jgi:hypothetical protein
MNNEVERNWKEAVLTLIFVSNEFACFTSIACVRAARLQRKAGPLHAGYTPRDKEPSCLPLQHLLGGTNEKVTKQKRRWKNGEIEITVWCPLG